MSKEATHHQADVSLLAPVATLAVPAQLGCVNGEVPHLFPKQGPICDGKFGLTICSQEDAEILAGLAAGTLGIAVDLLAEDGATVIASGGTTNLADGALPAPVCFDSSLPYNFASITVTGADALTTAAVQWIPDC